MSVAKFHSANRGGEKTTMATASSTRCARAHHGRRYSCQGKLIKTPCRSKSECASMTPPTSGAGTALDVSFLSSAKTETILPSQCKAVHDGANANRWVQVQGNVDSRCKGASSSPLPRPLPNSCLTRESGAGNRQLVPNLGRVLASGANRLSS